MKDLIIEQNESLVENVSSSVIDKLYQIALNSENHVSLSGNIQAVSAYEDAVQYLTAKFPKLHITVPNNNYYIRFADPVFERICKENWSSDGVGVTKTNLSQITTIRKEFFNLDIATWTDFQYITSSYITIPKDNCGLIDVGFDVQRIKDKYGDSIYNSADRSNPISLYPNGVDIIFPKSNIYLSGGSILFGANNYKVVVNVNSVNTNGVIISEGDVTYNTGTIYNGISFTWDDSFIPQQTSFKNISIFSSVKTEKVIFREGITFVQDNFSGCIIPYIVYPSTIENVGTFLNSFRRDAPNMSGVGAIVIKATVPPEMTTNNFNYSRLPKNIYVPDSAYNAYKNSNEYLWAIEEVKNLITKMSEMPQSLREELGVTDEDINRV